MPLGDHEVDDAARLGPAQTIARNAVARALRRGPADQPPPSAPDVDPPLAKALGVVLYADASQPSARRATRRRPASEPQLPIQIGGPPACAGLGWRAGPSDR